MLCWLMQSEHMRCGAKFTLRCMAMPKACSHRRGILLDSFGPSKILCYYGHLWHTWDPYIILGNLKILCVFSVSHDFPFLNINMSLELHHVWHGTGIVPLTCPTLTQTNVIPCHSSINTLAVYETPRWLAAWTAAFLEKQSQQRYNWVSLARSRNSLSKLRGADSSLNS